MNVKKLADDLFSEQTTIDFTNEKVIEVIHSLFFNRASGHLASVRPILANLSVEELMGIYQHIAGYASYSDEEGGYFSLGETIRPIETELINSYFNQVLWNRTKKVSTRKFI